MVLVVPAAHFIAIMVAIAVMVPVLITVSLLAMAPVVNNGAVVSANIAATRAYNSLFDRMFSWFLGMLISD
jgi:hypothetical protein